MIQIIGAGMAGLLAGQMLRRWKPIIREAQPSLPNNHAALLRFRTDAVSRATGIPFRRVTVHKGIVWDGMVMPRATIPMINAYALKVTDEVATRSIASLDTKPVERFIAPPDFIARLAEGLDLHYGEVVDASLLGSPHDGIGPTIISTIPMPALMEVTSWPSTIKFTGLPIWTLRATIIEPKVDVYQTLYYPEHEATWVPYRVSLTGNVVTAESRVNLEKTGPLIWLEDILSTHFGLGIPVKVSVGKDFSITRQQLGKILPVEESERRAFILAMTDRYGVYSLGRFATWRQILLDDVVQDVERIDRFMTERDGYARSLHWRTGS